MSRQATTRKENPDEVLLEGIPSWMRPSMERFIAHRIAQGRSVINICDPHYANTARVNAIERYLQIQLEKPRSIDTYFNVMQYIKDDEQCLDVVEAILATEPEAVYLISSLNTILTTSGSKWIAVVQDNGHATLEERVSESAQKALTVAIKESDSTARQFLKNAWGDAFGRSPNASSAYSTPLKLLRRHLGRRSPLRTIRPRWVQCLENYVQILVNGKPQLAIKLQIRA
jgi:hypothetical protein